MEQTRVFQIYLDPEGDGGEFRYKNEPGQIQRPHLVDRGDSLLVQGELSEVVHGALTPSGESGTIVVTDFVFLPSKNSRRFKAATITLRFESFDRTISDVEVTDIAPHGHFSLNRTTRHVELARSANASLQGGTLVNAGAGTSWELKESQDRKDQTTLSGAIRLEGRDYGGKNTARWTMNENKAQASGVPTQLRTVTRLKRRENSSGAGARFYATVQIKCSVDLASYIEERRDRLFGRIPEDDPVVFDPATKATTDSFDEQKLGSYDLSKYVAVVESNSIADESKD